MTPTETAAILRQFNDWRRGHHDEQPDPREIGEAIDAALEMIDRLEAAEEDRSNFLVEMGKLCAQCDALRTALTDLLNDLEERAKWNLEESQRVAACGNGVYMRAKAALEKSK